MDTHIQLYDEKIRPINRIEFGVLGNEEVRRMSALRKEAAGIEIPDLYDNMEPKRGGMIDTRLGVTSSLICSTCGFDSTNCVGHFGHIELAGHVFHMGYINFVKKILNCICLKCSKLLVFKNEEDILELIKNKSGKARFNEIKNLTRNVTYCAKPGYGCGTPVTKIKIEKKKNTCSIDIVSELVINIEAEGDKPASKKIIKQKLTPEICFDILKNISDSDCLLLGLNPKKNRPEYMIHKIFPVSPVAIRPSVKVVELSTKEDDLTIKLADIIKANVRLRKFKESVNDTTAKYSADHEYLLQYHIYTNFDNESCAVPKSEQRNKTTTSLSNRLKGKEGRIRGNLMGKRVNFCARTVITGDPTIDMDQLRLPIKIAKNLTIPEVVTPTNIAHLTSLCKNGRDVYPGANFIFPLDDGKRGHVSKQIDLRYGKGRIDLKYGDVVERHLINGDLALVNRQPSLHKLSMMGHRLKIIHDEKVNTFGLSGAVCKPYNADFDGDEMNIFIPQCCQTQIELEEIADVQKQIITPKNSVPIIGIELDSVIGSFNMTNANVKINWKTAMNIMSYTDADLDPLGKNKEYTGNQLYSMILPGDLNMTNNITIVNGQITKGRITGGMIQQGAAHNIVHNIWENNGHEETKRFINNAQRLSNNYNLDSGFTVGIGDTVIPIETKEEIQVIMKTKLLEMNHMITEMENNTDMMDAVTLEQTMHGELGAISGNVSKLVMSKLPSSNNFNIMVGSKSKGSESNIGQIVGCFGQLVVENKRIQKKFNGRTLSYFPQHDDSAIARGFVQQSFINGLNPREFVFLNMAAREGTLDTAIKTAETGYIQRRLVKCLEDVFVTYDSTVRTANNSIIQFVYGDIGVNTTRQSRQELKFLELSNGEIEEKIKFTSDELAQLAKSGGRLSTEANDAYVARVFKIRDKLRKHRLATAVNNITFESTFMLPVNFTNIVLNTIHNKSGDTTRLDPEYVIDAIEGILDYSQTKNTSMSTESYNAKSYKYKDELASKLTLRFALYQHLSPKICIFEHGFSKTDFDNICKYIVQVYNKAIVEPGEMVGVVSAQSLGESTTQMTLKSFHTAGKGSSVSGGVPRIKELMGLSRNIKTPAMEIYIKQKYRQNLGIVNKIQSQLKYITIKDIRKKIEIYFDPEPFDSHGIMARDNVQNVFYKHNPNKNSCQANIMDVPWLVRVELDKEQMLEKNITLLDIKSKFCNVWEKKTGIIRGFSNEEKALAEKITHIAVLSNYDNSKQPVLHIRIDMVDFDFMVLTNFMDMFIDNFKLKGLANIEKTTLTEDEQLVVFDKKTGEMRKEKQHVIYTNGTNMVDIRYINGIDLKKTICNDVMTIYELFGIDAARNVLVKQFTSTFKDTGATVNFAHIELLCDFMTHTGVPVSIDRHGNNKLDIDTLARISFEQPVENLITASVFGEVDHMTHVSSRIMSGLVIKGGTGLCNIILDTELLERSEYKEGMEPEYVKTYNEITTNNVMDDIVNKEVHGIFIPN